MLLLRLSLVLARWPESPSKLRVLALARAVSVRLLCGTRLGSDVRVPGLRFSSEFGDFGAQFFEFVATRLAVGHIRGLRQAERCWWACRS